MPRGTNARFADAVRAHGDAWLRDFYYQAPQDDAFSAATFLAMQDRTPDRKDLHIMDTCERVKRREGREEMRYWQVSMYGVCI